MNRDFTTAIYLFLHLLLYKFFFPTVFEAPFSSPLLVHYRTTSPDVECPLAASLQTLPLRSLRSLLSAVSAVAFKSKRQITAVDSSPLSLLSLHSPYFSPFLSPSSPSSNEARQEVLLNDTDRRQKTNDLKGYVNMRGADPQVVRLTIFG